MITIDNYKLAMKYRDLFVSTSDEIIQFLYHATFETDLSAPEISRQIGNILVGKKRDLREIDRNNY